jgi:hypothetical protein
MITDFEPLFKMSSSAAGEQIHKVYKTKEGKFLNVVDIAQASGVERVVIGEFDTLKEAFDSMVETFETDEEMTFMNHDES